MMPPSAARSHLRSTRYRRSFSNARTASLVSYEGNKGPSRKPGFRYTGFSETGLHTPAYLYGTGAYGGEAGLFSGLPRRVLPGNSGLKIVYLHHVPVL